MPASALPIVNLTASSAANGLVLIHGYGHHYGWYHCRGHHFRLVAIDIAARQPLAQHDRSSCVEANQVQ
jgi:hypothetical protein